MLSSTKVTFFLISAGTNATLAGRLKDYSCSWKRDCLKRDPPMT